MALIVCRECGAQISDMAAACPHCGCPYDAQFQSNQQNQQYAQQDNNNEEVYVTVSPLGILGFIVALFLGILCIKKGVYSYGIIIILLGVLAIVFGIKNNKKPVDMVWNNQQVLCPNCGGNNIQISVDHVERITGERSEVRKKSIPARMGNSLGRGGLIMLTGGLWALTPKRSKYNEITKVKSKTIQYKVGVCQHCGYSWYM